MNNDLLSTLISLAPTRAVDTKSSPLQPESSSELSTTVPQESRPPIPPTPFHPLSALDSIPTTSQMAKPSEALDESAVATIREATIASRPATEDIESPLSGTSGRAYRRETANHRFIAILHLQGETRSDIASRLGISESTVTTVLASQNARAFMGAKLEAVFKDQTLERLTGLAERAVTELQGILEDPDVRAADKLKAIAMVLDRRFGQTTQVVKHVQGDLSKMSDADLLAVIGETTTETIDV